MKLIKIQSVSDIITNSSSEVFIEKIDSFGILDEILECLDMKDHYTYFCTEEDIKNWFYGIKEEDLWWESDEQAILEEAEVYYDTFGFEKYNEDGEEIHLSRDEMWDNAKDKLIKYLLGNAVCFWDRDDMYDLWVHKKSDEIRQIRYKHYKENPETYSFEDRFVDWFGNILNIDDVVVVPNDFEDENLDEKYRSPYAICKIKAFDLLEDGSFNVTLSTHRGDRIEHFTGHIIERFIKFIPKEFYGMKFWDENTKGLKTEVKF